MKPSVKQWYHSLKLHSLVNWSILAPKLRKMSPSAMRKKVVARNNASPPANRRKVFVLNEEEVDNTLIKNPKPLLEKTKKRSSVSIAEKTKLFVSGKGKETIVATDSDEYESDPKLLRQ